MADPKPRRFQKKAGETVGELKGRLLLLAARAVDSSHPDARREALLEVLEGLIEGMAEVHDRASRRSR